MRFGLLGKDIGYSKSPKIWAEIWDKEGRTDYSFELVDTDDPISFLKEFRESIKWHGLMVTTPYKQLVLPKLDILSQVAQEVGAVNAISKINGKLIGFNTDVYGFLAPLSDITIQGKALVLGSGGASRAIQYALKSRDIDYQVVSRNPNFNQIGYEDVTPHLLDTVRLIVNATPLGGPKLPYLYPDIPYKYLNDNHILYDLSYSEKIVFLDAAPSQCTKINGNQMLYYQALEANRIFMSLLR